MEGAGEALGPALLTRCVGDQVLADLELDVTECRAPRRAVSTV